MVDIIRGIQAVVNHYYMAHNLHQVFFSKNPLSRREIEAEPLVELIAAYLAQVIAPCIEEEGIHQSASVVDCRGVPRPQPLVEVD